MVVVDLEAATDVPALLPVDVEPDLQAMLDRWPLPDGTEDADCNQEEIAMALRTTVTTVAKWIKQDGMPVVQAGGNGRAYVLRLSHCYAWRMAREHAAAQRDEHNRRQIAALQASFLGLAVEDPRAQMSAAERRAMAEADIAWSKAARDRRQLVPLQDVVDLLDALCKHIAEGLRNMPDRLEREIGLKPDQVRAAIRIGDDIMADIKSNIEQAEMSDVDVPEVEVSERWVI